MPVVTAVLAAVLFGCTAPPPAGGTLSDGAPAADLAAVRRAVRDADSAFAAAATAHDLEGSVASLTADAIMFPPDLPPIVGRSAIREYMRQSFATPHFSITWTTDTVVVVAGGDMAYSFARSRYTFPAHSGRPDAVDTA
ncbi:YybH family protein [Gemmatimonas sp.]|uniref:YybH family protein n=1 Tax=Gemmatimonas sp. TaxID=1962908 RepID=UPI0039837324